MIQFFVIGQWLLATIPNLLMASLFALSIRATQFLGKNPNPFDYDPGQIGREDALYQFWYATTDWLLALFILSLYVWLPWTIITVGVSIWQLTKGRSQSWINSGVGAILVYLLGILLMMVDPNNHFGWYLD